MFETKDGKILKLITYFGIRSDDSILLVEYKQPPNPNTKGWWVPGPELNYGDDPEEAAQNFLRSIGYREAKVKLVGTESFVSPGGWHFILKYVADVPEPKVPQVAPFEKWRFFGRKDLPEAKELAHGKWERNLALELLRAGR